MKICVESSMVFPLPWRGYAGLEIIAWECARGLAARGHEVALIAPDGSQCPGVQMIHAGPPGTPEDKAYSTYWQHLPHFDVIISHGWTKPAYMLKREGRLPAPVLGVCHAPVDTMFKSLPQVDKPCFVLISDDQRVHFENLYGRPGRTCRNGIDTNFYRSLNMPRTDRFLFLARFSSVKSPDMAIEACLQAGVGLDLVGDTTITNEPELLAQCRRWADGKQIRIIGGIPRGECVYWYSQAHAMIHPNMRFREPFGLAPVEAMACGTPVIAWDNGAMRETIDLTCGHLDTSIDGLVATIKEFAKGIPPEMRAACRKQAEKFTLARMVERYEELCFEAVSTGGW